MVPVRDDPPPEYGATWNKTRPGQVPDAPDVTCKQLALSVAVHGHVSAVVTAIGPPNPPSPLKCCDVGEIAYVHPEA